MSGDPERFEIVKVKSGAHSLRSLEFGETFHPVVGPMLEARELHVRQQQLLARAGESNGRFIIWDVGLGAAANAIAVLEAFQGFRGEAQIELHSFDHTTAPLEFALQHASELTYVALHPTSIRSLLATGSWVAPGEPLADQRRPQQLRADGSCDLPAGFRWQLHLGDFRVLVSSEALPAPHAILYDPYSPKSNPGMWTLEHCTRLRRRLRRDAPCLLTNYTRSTAVRVTLLLAGFFVGRGCGIGEKDETTVATNRRELLERPLEAAWLSMVQRSTKGAPLREGSTAGPIAAADLALLTAHPQFSQPWPFIDTGALAIAGGVADSPPLLPPA